MKKNKKIKSFCKKIWGPGKRKQKNARKRYIAISITVIQAQNSRKNCTPPGVDFYSGVIQAFSYTGFSAVTLSATHPAVFRQSLRAGCRQLYDPVLQHFTI